MCVFMCIFFFGWSAIVLCAYCVPYIEFIQIPRSQKKFSDIEKTPLCKKSKKIKILELVNTDKTLHPIKWISFYFWCVRGIGLAKKLAQAHNLNIFYQWI